MNSPKKLIEVALPLEAINAASAREKSIRHGHPSTLHLWWARRPLAAARAVIFAQMVDDPSSRPDLFKTEKEQEKERKRLFHIIEELVKWENTTNEKVLQAARDEIWASWRRTCADNADHPRAKELFDRDKLPAFHDPFAGGGSLPLEAQRLGLEAYASDLNPVAVLINKAMIEIPPKFAGRPPVNPEARADKSLFNRGWKGAQGLADDVRYYGKWMRDEAEKRIGHLYPKVEVTAEMAKDRPDLKPYVGKKLTVIAWIWARTVKSPNPAFAKVDVPLASTFMLSTKKGKEAYVEPVIENGGYRFTVKVGKPADEERAGRGTKLKGANFECVMSGASITAAYIKIEARSNRLGARLVAIVTEGDRGRVYFAPSPEQEAAATAARPTWKPDVEFFQQALGFRVGNYGMSKWSDLFTPRQLTVLATLSNLVIESRDKIHQDATVVGLPDDGRAFRAGGIGATGYAEATALYLGLLVDQVANHCSSVCGWNAANTQMRSVFARQALPMVWDYAESNPFSESSGSYSNLFERQVKGFDALGDGIQGSAILADANRQEVSLGKIVSTDPPYYDNIGYADLSDFFYVWIRRSQREAFPELFATLAVPKDEELVATPHRHGSMDEAERFFLGGMTRAMHRLAEQAHPAFPITVFYAFKQSEDETGSGVASTGWETFLEALIRAEFSITGTWPIRTEKKGRVRGNDSNALASSIILVCRKRSADASTISRGEFDRALRRELPGALVALQKAEHRPRGLGAGSYRSGHGGLHAIR